MTEPRYRPYTGIGSRGTPTPVKKKMTAMAKTLAAKGFTLRSGGARGADTAFQEGADKVEGLKEIFLPWEGFEEAPCKTGCQCTYVLPMDHERRLMSPQVQQNIELAEEVAASIHPAWGILERHAQLLHTRNVMQVMGSDLSHESMFLICWTEGGKLKGGTRTAIKVALQNKVPVYNLGSKDWTLAEIVKDVRRRRMKGRVATRQIFMGNGDDSGQQCDALMHSLDQSLSLLSGLQQGGALRGTPEYRAVINTMRNTVLDVATGLGFKITIHGELPYEEEQ